MMIQKELADAKQKLLIEAKLLANTPGLVEATARRDVDEIWATIVVGASLLHLDDIDVVDVSGERLVVLIAAQETYDSDQEDRLLDLAMLGIETTDIFLQEKDQEWEARLVATIPLHAESGEIVGAVLVGRKLDDEFLSKLNFSQSNVKLTLIHQGQIVAQSGAQAVGDGAIAETDRWKTALLNQTAIQQAVRGQPVVNYSLGNVPYTTVHLPVGVGDETEAVIAIWVDLSGSAAIQNQLIRNFTGVIVLLALVAIGSISLFTRRSIVIPIRELGVAAERMRAGDLTAQARFNSGDEIGVLATSFNDMAARLRKVIGLQEARAVELSQVNIALQGEIAERIRAEETLQKSEIQLRSIIENSQDGIVLVNEEGKIIEWNFGQEQITGIGQNEALGSTIWDIQYQLSPEKLKTPEHYNRLKEMALATLKSGEALWLKRPLENNVRRLSNGISRIMQTISFPIRAECGWWIGVISRDVTEQKKAAEALQQAHDELEARVKERTRELQESEARYRSLFEDSPISLWEEDFTAVKQYIDDLRASDVSDLRVYFKTHPEAVHHCVSLIKVLNVNRATLDFYAVQNIEDFLNEGGIASAYTEEVYDTFQEELISLANGETRFSGEFTMKNGAGDKLYLSLNLSVTPGYEQTWAKVFVSIVDITERVRAEAQIQTSLAEKEALLKEIHHRVKNNLQVIASMLNMQARYTQDEQTIEHLLDSKNRVYSMALVHENLYRSDTLARIDSAAYISDLVNNILQFYMSASHSVELKLDIAQIFLTIDQAAPCGLIINELVTNAFKHAFPLTTVAQQAVKGEIRVEFSQHENDMLLLTVSDNGVGVPQEVDLNAGKTLGLRLVKSLSRQLDASLAIETGSLTKFSLLFRKM
ncbi:MAG: PAS domain S-box protein [Anaerolineaceae bacterium]|nr:PAS domain S-box protein [Anaerolineaceae bacterium]